MASQPRHLRGRSLSRLAALALSLVGCASAPAPERPVRGLVIPVRDVAPHAAPTDDDLREDPPESEPSRPFTPPVIAREKLADGAELSLVASKAHGPLVEARVVLIGAGAWADQERPGLSWLAAAAALEGGTTRGLGRDGVERLERDGARVHVKALPHALVVQVTAHRDRVHEVLEGVVRVLREPRLDANDMARARRRLDEPSHLEAIVARDLLGAPGLAPTSAELDKLTPADLKAFTKKRYAASIVRVIAVGDVDPKALKAPLDRALAGFAAPLPPVERPTPSPPRVLLVDLPALPRVDVALAGLTTLSTSDPAAPDEIALQAALSLAFSGASSRLASSLRETPSVAPPSLSIARLGPSLFAWRAATSAPEARAAVVAQALVDELRRLATQSPTEPELVATRRKLQARVHATFTAAAPLADLLAEAAQPGLDPDAAAQALARVEALTAELVQKAAQLAASSPTTLAALADATRAASSLTPLGDVAIASPDRGYERTRTLPASPSKPRPSDATQAPPR